MGTVFLVSIWFLQMLLWTCSEGSVSSGLSRFGLSPLQHEPCQVDQSEPHANFITNKTSIPCLTATLRLDKCKQQTHAAQTYGEVGTSVVSNWTVLQAYYDRHHGFRTRQELFDGSCLELTPGNCTQYRCMKVCYTGWEMDEVGKCSRQQGSDNQCKNGGTYDSRFRQCFCRAGFTGRNCEIVKCADGCENGGQCLTGSDGEPYCECPTLYYGPQCQYEKRCDEECENGGSCVPDGPDVVCVCPEGFIGKTCAQSLNNDELCPPLNTTVCTELSSCLDRCESSGDCLGSTVCCSDGCCRRCVPPRSPGCLYKGHQYKPRQWFTDGCQTCLCGSSGSVSCLKKTCHVPVTCKHVDYTVDKCCGTCADLPGHNGKGPTVNCSGDIKMVYVSKNFLTVDMDQLDIRATDANGRSLKVRYEPSRLTHCRCSATERDVSLIRVTATDSLGQTADCEQRVYVADRIPPHFVICGFDVYVKEGEAVTWREPIATDNVGIISLQRNYKPYQTFPVGTTAVFYTATDYDYNKAVCKFYVHVSAKHNGRTDSYTDFSETAHAESYKVIVGCVGGLVVMLMAVLVCVIVYRRMRLKNARRRRPTNMRRDMTSIPAVSNLVYDNMGGEFIGLDGVTLKPPPYSPPSSPPSYEDLYDNETPPGYESLRVDSTS